MTREEEIKARLAGGIACYCEVKKDHNFYIDLPNDKIKGMQANSDLAYLLARNEELQRRVNNLESALVGIKEEAAAFASDERDLGYIFIGIYTLATNVLDAKGQDDD